MAANLEALSVSLDELEVAWQKKKDAADDYKSIVEAVAEKAGRKSGHRLAYVTDPTNRVIFGCYFATDNHIFINYSDGDVRAYNYKGWTLNPNAGGAR